MTDVAINFTGTSNVDQAALDAKAALEELLSTVTGLQEAFDSLSGSTSATGLDQAGAEAQSSGDQMLSAAAAASEHGSSLEGLAGSAQSASQSLVGLAGEGLGPLNEMLGVATEAATGFSEEGLLGIVAAGGAAIATFGELGRAGGSFVTDIAKISATLGLSVEETDQLALRFEDAGSSATTLIRLGSQLSVVMSQYADAVAKGSPPSLKARTIQDELGVSLTTSTGALRNQGEVLQDVLFRLGNMTDAGERARISAELFGSRISGQVNLALQDYAANTAKVLEQSDRLGLSQVDVAQTTHDYNTAMTDLDIEMQRLELQVLPTFITVLEDLDVAVQTGEKAFGPLADAIQRVNDALPGMDNVEQIAGVLWLVSPPIAIIVGSAGTLVTALSDAGDAFGTFQEKGAAVADAMTHVGGDIVNGLRGGIEGEWDSFISWLQDKYDEIPSWARHALEIASPSQVMSDIGEQIPAGMQQGFDNAFPSFQSDVETQMNGIIGMVEGQVNALLSKLANAKSAWLDLGMIQTIGALNGINPALAAGIDGFSGFQGQTVLGYHGGPPITLGSVQKDPKGGAAAGKAYVQDFADAMTQALTGMEMETEFGKAGGKVLEAFGAALHDPAKGAAIAPAIATLIEDAEKANVPHAAELGAALINAVGDGLHTGDWEGIYAAMHNIADSLGEVSVAHQKAADEIAKDQAKLGTAYQDTADKVADATAKEQENLAKLAQSHQDALAKISASIAQAKADFADAEAQRTADSQDAEQTRHANAADAEQTRHDNAQDAYDRRHRDEADQMQTLLDQHTTNLDKINTAEQKATTYAQYQAFEQQRTDEDKKYAAAIAAEQKKVARADADAAAALAKQDAAAAKALQKQDEAAAKSLAKQEEAAAKAEQKKEAALQASIDAENKKYAEQVAAEKKRYDDQLKALEDSYAKQEKALEAHMAAMAAIEGIAPGHMRPVTIDWSVPADPNSPAMRWDSANQRWVDTGHMPIPGYAAGTPFVPQDGPAYLHKGEAVIPAAANQAGIGGGAMTQVVNFHGPVTLGGVSSQDQIPQVVFSLRQAMNRQGMMN